MENNSKFVDERINQFQSSLEESKEEVDECNQKILYLEVYSRGENLKFEGIVEVLQNNASSTRSEISEEVLVDFLENVLRIDRPIIACFLRFSDRERVFKQGRKLKGTNYRMFEDIPKELHQKRKVQMGRLTKARKEGRRAKFSRSEQINYLLMENTLKCHLAYSCVG